MDNPFLDAPLPAWACALALAHAATLAALLTFILL